MARAASVALALVVLATACGSTVQSHGTVSLGDGGQGLAGSGGTPDGQLGGGANGSTGGSTALTPTGAGGVAGPGQAAASGAGSRPGSTSGTQGSVATTGSGGASAQSIPESGPGWDKGHIYIGVTTETDTATVGASLGLNSLDFGDQTKMAKTYFDSVNKAGGLFGRQLIEVTYDYQSTKDVSQAAQEACTKWTQDRRVAVVIMALVKLNVRQLYSCLAKAKLPLVGQSYYASMQADMQEFAPYVNLLNGIFFDRLADPWINRLTATKYFSPWDNVNGKPGAAPVKIGILYAEDPLAGKAWNFLKRRLVAHSIPVTDVISYASTGELQNAVLKFRQDGVTHVFLDAFAGLLFPSEAQSQNYFGRYAVTSQNLIQPFLQGTAPASQLAGMAGVGWVPQLDVDQARDPGPTPGSTACYKLMRDGGVDLSKRNFQFAAAGTCDLFGVAFGGIRNGGLNAPSLLSGIGASAPRFAWSSIFSGGSRPGAPDFVDSLRDLYFDTSCQCVRYAKTTPTRI